MKRVLLAILLVSTMVFSQELVFKQGTNVINAGLNIANWDGVGVVAAWDHGAFNNMFSLGADLGFYHSSDKWSGGKTSYNNLSPNFRFAFHPFGIPALDSKVKVADKLDPYAVVKAGLTMQWSSIKYNDNRDNDTDFDVSSDFSDFFNLNLGIRWYFNGRANLWAELGPWNAVIGAGINF